MSGLTPNAFGNEPTGLQDVLAFIADFEMGDSHDSDGWMDEEISTADKSIALWKKMAERQKSQRDLVETENIKLREKLKTQVRMAKSLQRILRKRERAAEQITGEIPKRLKHLASGQAVPTGGEFNPLVQSLDALYALTNERMNLCPVATGSQPLLREQDVKYNDFSGMFLEFVHSKLIPFDVNAVSRAIWRHMSEPGIKFNAYFEEVRSYKSSYHYDLNN
eukprot:jgi/Phyca11/19665/fgenesh1_pg.PHYCAscaffold_50_\